MNMYVTLFVRIRPLIHSFLIEDGICAVFQIMKNSIVVCVYML